MFDITIFFLYKNHMMIKTSLFVIGSVAIAGSLFLLWKTKNTEQKNLIKEPKEYYIDVLENSA
jgi:hypothetical protein